MNLRSFGILITVTLSVAMAAICLILAGLGWRSEQPAAVLAGVGGLGIFMMAVIGLLLARRWLPHRGSGTAHPPVTDALGKSVIIDLASSDEVGLLAPGAEDVKAPINDSERIVRSINDVAAAETSSVESPPKSVVRRPWWRRSPD